MNKSQADYYNSDYYKSHCGNEYERDKGWERFFGNCAERISKEICPKKTLDVGCAKGFLVEAFRDRGVEAYGIDISEYAISEVRDDVTPFCQVKSVLLPIEEKYDLITCIEVLEHLESQDIATAIKNMCEASDDIIFSSTPFDYNEESHISVHTPDYWVEQFAYNGFFHDVKYDCSYIAVQAMRFRRMEKTKIELIRDYESALFEKTQGLFATRQNQKLAEDNVLIYKQANQKYVDKINEELNPRIVELETKLQILEGQTKEEIQQWQVKTQVELEEKYRVQVEMLIADKKNVEQDLYAAKEFEDAAYHRECVAYKKVNEIRKLNYRLLKNRYGLLDMNLFQYLKAKYRYKRQEKYITGKPIEYWKPVFDSNYYAEEYEDVRNEVGQDERALLQHFLQFGVYEGRSGNAEFNSQHYLNLNKDVEDYFFGDNKAACIHYIEIGQFEKRDI